MCRSASACIILPELIPVSIALSAMSISIYSPVEVNGKCETVNGKCETTCMCRSETS